MKEENLKLFQVDLKHTCFDVNADKFEIHDNAVYFFIDHVKICVLELSDVYLIARFREDDFVYDFVNALYYDQDDIIYMNLR